MPENRAIDEAIQSIHSTFEQAEYQLAQLGPETRFLIGPEGQIEIVRRERNGATVSPKVVIAELKGCDPMLWRPDYPSWMRVLDPARRRADPASTAAGSPPNSSDQDTGGPESGGTEPESTKPETAGTGPEDPPRQA